MLVIGDNAAPPPRAVVQEPGGFVWWYLDLGDRAGNGVVVIVGFGLPFLPGVEGAGRAGHPVPARERPSVTVSTYRQGRPDLYLFQEVPADQATWGDDGVDLPGVVLRWSEGSVRVDLDLQVPGSADRLHGSVEVSGARAQLTPDAPGPHTWSPVIPAGTGRATLTHGRWSHSVQGEGYHDRNHCTVPLSQLGIAKWSWGRVALPDATWIWYWLESQSPDGDMLRLLRVAPDGAVHELAGPQVTAEGWRRDRYGLRWCSTLTLRAEGATLQVDQGAPVDRGPFYLRHPVSLTVDGQSGAGWSELVVPPKLDVAWQRPLVRMRVADPMGRDSMWLPLFSGPRRGRVRRLLGMG